MKICILTHTFPRYKNDYAAPFMDGVAYGQTEAGNDVFVLTPYTRGFKRKVSDQKYTIVTYKYVWPESLHMLGYSNTLKNDMGVPKIMYALSPLMYFFGLVALIKLIKKEKINIINAHWIVPNGFIASIASYLTGVPVVSTLPGSDVYIAQKPQFRWMARFATRRSKWITSNSPQLLEDLAKINHPVDIKARNLLMKKFSPIIYGTYPSIFKPNRSAIASLRKKHNIPKDHVVIVSVGRLVPKKGFSYLIEAIPTVLKKYNKVTFLIVGEGDQRNDLTKLVKKLNVESHIIFPGWVKYDKLVNYYNLADVFILPSIRDEKGNLDDQSVSVVEAMSCGKPIVTTNFPGYKIVIEDGKNGYLISEKSLNEIASVLGKLVASKPLRDKMGKHSRQLVQVKFSWNAIGQQYNDLFKKLLS
ncbi:glycosyltransferase [Candidatus Woesebacteria bacterium]|nr:MAG: glycosyltransferase [Candidatus Woesebacteria bacterium]